MSNAEYRIQFPVGDWSNDGHGKCEYYVVSSNKPVEALRELHHSCKKKFGFSIGDICKEYEANILPQKIADILYSHGVDLQNYADDWDWADEVDGDKHYIMGPDSIIALWLKIYELLDPTVILSVVVTSEISIHYYGYDSQGRHVDTPGYGVFSG